MSLTLNTNIDSLTAQNNLTSSQSLLSQSLTRLSSGLRINSAADDAAGLAIAQGFTTQVNGTNQAINNANDAVAEAQTTAGALTTIVNTLQSIRTLAVEAANGSNSASDRTALNNQVQQQIQEISQIASQTTFNGASVLNGADTVQTYQVGADVGNTITVDLGTGVEASQIGQYASVSSTASASGTALTTGSLTLNVNGQGIVAIGAAQAGSINTIGQAASSAYATAAAINSAGIEGLTATASNSDALAEGNVVAGTGGATYSLTLNGINIFGSGGDAIAANGTLTQAQVESAINLDSSQTGVTATVNTNGGLTLAAADGSTIQYSQTITGGTGGFTATSGTQYGTVTLSASNSIIIAGNSPGYAGFTAGTTGQGTTTLANDVVTTVSGATQTIESVDSALQTVNALQSQLGAIQNRFTAAVQSLTSTSLNLVQSRSTIQDANFAQETANLTQAQVLEQAGISVLAQANQEPQLILKLLQ